MPPSSRYGPHLKTQGYGGHPMNVHIHRRRPARVAAWLREAGFTVEVETILDPEEEFPAAILFARRRSWCGSSANALITAASADWSGKPSTGALPRG